MSQGSGIHLEEAQAVARPACRYLENVASVALLNQTADTVVPSTVAAGTIPPPLPPSVEAAYKKKCIELKRRLVEVDEDNDSKRLRIARLHLGIRKMRLERAYLLEALAKRQKKNGSSVDGFPVAYDEESEGSSEGPPTVW